MKTYLVTYEGQCRETYTVEAESEEEARKTWRNWEIDVFEMLDGEVVNVEEAE